MKQRIAALLCLILSGCGYRWNQDSSECRPSFSIPYVVGDEDGSFTSELVSALASSGLVDVYSRDADFRLEVSIVEQRNETIGFRRDPQKVYGKVKNNLLASEGRKIIAVEATVYRKDSGEVAYGPYRIQSEADYDYIDGDSLQQLIFFSSSGKAVTVLPFSLGQLEPIESAQEAALKPIYRRISQKIVDVISSEW